MKKLLMTLLMLVLLAKLPLAEWNKIPDKELFLQRLGAVFCEMKECPRAIVGVMEIGDEALFFGDCLPEEQVKL